MKSTESNTASLRVVGVDIGKEVFHLVGLGLMGRSLSAGGSSAWVSKMLSSSYRHALLGWKLV
jgi:hypothetical protein